MADDAIEQPHAECRAQAGALRVLHNRSYRIHQRVADSYRCGRMLLAGDAAHLNSPSGGMGMNGGIHDAFNLSREVAPSAGGRG